MNFTATIINDVIQLPAGMHFPDGTSVVIEPLIAPVRSEKNSLSRSLLEFAGIADDLPPDLARNLDHYLHGQPKQP
jgi:hypothetical protein